MTETSDARNTMSGSADSIGGMRVREPIRRVVAHRQTEGGGFVVRRPFPSETLRECDPFLLIDEMGPVDYAPGEAVGAPDHPHRGFETITYMLDGEFEHEDSAGHRGKLVPGAVQWMTAGRGVVHSEMPSKRILRDGGRIHGFQIWVNLPARSKMTEPRYQELEPSGVPTGTSADGLATVKVVAGEQLGVRGPVDVTIPITFADWSLAPGADVTVPLPEEQTGLAYVFDGDARIGDRGDRFASGELAVLGEGDTLRLRGGDAPARILLLAARPLGEPVSRYGPFVMNTYDEIRQAVEDYQSGRLGEIRRSG